MGSKALKPQKIRINNNTASGMYILLYDDEIRFTKDNETKPPNRIYQIQIAVEAMYNHKRCRGKKNFTIHKGTSIIKAVADMQKYKVEMQTTLREKGTLKQERKNFKQINSKDRKLSSVYEAWINGKKINQSPTTVRLYDGCYNTHLTKLKNKIIDDITEDDIQNIINTMLNNGKSPSTINMVKMVMKPLLDINDVQLNWKKIILPKNDKKRTFKGTDEDAKKITKALLEYKHPIMRGIFAFLLSGRRIGETLQLEYKHIDFNSDTFTLPKEITKTKTSSTYVLTPLLLNAIKSQKTTTGKIFALKRDAVNYHFHKVMQSINVHNMVMHDIRSMVAVVALRNGADIYAVSKMLSHKLLSTTEKSYIGNGTERAIEAQNTFLAVAGNTGNVIDVEVSDTDTEYEALKKIYPNATDEKIYEIMEMMK
ncbi:tyrosine-type recombinase/integrase [Sulfurimonas hydrogeniphila]|uniref:tyrosine-type recombinase/integrase n=1 Tax=Sulfurimonas TaxID=202746 RepID=UPI00125EBAAB|nr:tyrosine-type recombinase/integrase [Sulfurimonas hydrogeniphila]